MERIDAGDWVSACRNMAVVGNAGKGGPNKRWNEVVKDDLKKCGLDGGLSKDRERWKTAFMGKTSDLCEHGHSHKGHKTRSERGRKREGQKGVQKQTNREN